MTKRQRIDASREARLWLGQIIVPTLTVVGTIMATNPELRQSVANKVQDVKASAKEKCSGFRKDKS